MGFDNVNVNVSGPVQPTSTYKTKVLKGNHSFASQITEPNMKYVIKHDFTLGEDITVPENCILEFDGGSVSGNYTITGNNTGINAGLVKVFSTDVTLTGTWNVDYLSIVHFGAKSNNSVQNSKFINTNDSSDAIQAALNTGLPIEIPVGNFYISKTINIPAGASIFGYDNGGEVDAQYFTARAERKVSRIYTDSHITMFSVKGNIMAKNFYVDTVDVNSNEVGDVIVFNFDSDCANSGSYIKTYIYGQKNIPFITIAYLFDGTNGDSPKKGYLQNLYIDGTIQRCAYGVWIQKCVKNGTRYRWVNSITIMANIVWCKCHHRLESGYHHVIGGVQQNGVCFTQDEYGQESPMTLINGADDVRLDPTCHYYDVGRRYTTPSGMHRYAIQCVNLGNDSDYCEYSSFYSNIVGDQELQNLSYEDALITDIEVLPYTESYTEPKVNPISGINVYPFARQTPYGSIGFMDLVHNNDLFFIALNDTNYTIKAYSSNDVEITGLSLNYKFMSGYLNEYNLGSMDDGGYIEIDNVTQSFYSGYFIINQRLGGFAISKAEIYKDGVKIAENSPLIKEGMIGLTYIKLDSVLTGAKKIRLYLRKVSAANTIKFCVSHISGYYMSGAYLSSEVACMKRGNLTIADGNFFVRSKRISEDDDLNFPVLTAFNGNNNQRPTKGGLVNSGFMYFNYQKGKYEIFNGSSNKWLEYDGAVARVNRSGAFVSKPSSSDIYIGFQYFNTDTHKMITWDGTKWYNPDGTEAVS